MKIRFSFLLVVQSLILLSLLNVTFSLAGEKVKKRDLSNNLTHSEDKVYQNQVFHKHPLYYYHKYLSEMGNMAKKVPLNTHYGNERRLRKEHYHYLNEISKIKEQKLFKLNDIKHEILKFENEKVINEES